MKKALRNVYYFLPVQLLLLHFRKYQLLLGFWLILVATITGNFASHFGASALFLSPEYLGQIDFYSAFLLGAAMGVFIMGWHITTFIIHSKRIHFMGAIRHAFLLYCINNALIPVLFLIFYSISIVHYQWYYEHATTWAILKLQLGFYLGIFIVVLISFLYFFRVGRDLIKTILSRITNPSVIRDLIPYDSLDFELDIIHCETFIGPWFKILPYADLETYHPRVSNIILRRHHRNAIFATLVAYIGLITLGVFMEEPLLRIPAGAGFLILFSIIMGLVGAVKYFLKSWEAIGWVMIVVLLSVMVKFSFFDFRSVAYGLYYRLPVAQQPHYEYDSLRKLFTPQRYAADKITEEGRLDKWKNKFAAGNVAEQPPLIVITVSGGGARSAYFTFRTLQFIDSVTKGRLFDNTVLMTGASGGMIGAAYWRSIHDAYKQGLIKNPYDPKYQDNVGKDLLNAIIFSMASVDLISPFNKITVAGYSYTRDRGYAMEQEMIHNTDGLMDKSIGYFKQREADGTIPQMIINGTIINDGRKLMVSTQPISYLTQPEYSTHDTANPTIDAVDFAAFFSKQDPYNLRITTALRMNATFPFILPVMKFPSHPYMNVMDAGLRDNFGTEVASRYLFTMRDWLTANTRKVIFLEIRDTRENQVLESTNESSLGAMIGDPIFVIQNKWESFQSYYRGYLKDYAPYFLGGRLRFVTMSYVPYESQKIAALNFHLTQKEKEDLYQSIDNPINQVQVDTLLQLLR